MSKAKKTLRFKAPVVDEVASVDAVEEVPPVYSFQSVSRCPRCRGLKTLATSTQGGTQYRRCAHPLCGAAYKEAGTRVDGV
jgi:hypothetical protein